MYPEIILFGQITFRTYTVLFVAAVLLSLIFMAWQGGKTSSKPVKWLDAGLIAVAAGIIGARAAHVAIHWNYFSQRLDQTIELWRGGLDWHGGVLLGLAGLWIGCAIQKVSFRRALDLCAVIPPAGGAFLYTGCLMSACGYGWEVRTLAAYPPFVVGELPDMYGIVAPRLIPQAYGIAASLIVIALLSLLARFAPRVRGHLWIALVAMALSSFGIGFALGDPMLMLASLRLDQWLDLLVAAVGLIGWIITMHYGGDALAEKNTETDAIEAWAGTD